MAIPAKVNYLNNKDLLAEIHKSKMSYCYYVDDKYKDYDAIVPSVDKITKKLIKEIQKRKAEEQTKALKVQAKADGLKPSEIEKIKPVKIKDIDPQTFVFRVMTYEHIPIDTNRTRKARTESEKHVRLNFNPYKHYIQDKDGTFKEVGRSHWEGGLKNGHFNPTTGKMTNKLALMLMKLVEKYAVRGNWRNYTYNDEMRGQALLQLSQIALKFDEGRSQNPFAYFTTSITNSFTSILNSEKKNQNIRDDMLMAHGVNPSFNRQLDDLEAQRRE